MPMLGRVSVNTRLKWMGIMTAAALLVAVGVGLGGNHTLSGSSQKAFVAKDVVADILPPPMYLIELRLVLSQLMEGTLDLPTAKKEVERLTAEYDARVAYWREHPPFGLERHLLGEQHARGQEFIVAARDLVGMYGSGEPGLSALRLSAVDRLYLLHRAGVDSTVKTGSALAEQSMQAFDSAASAAQLGLVVILGVGLVGTFALGRAIGRSVAIPLEAAVQFAESVAEGNLSVKHAVQGHDEAARLFAALNAMSANLCEDLGRVHECGQQVAASSQQIAASNEDLSARANNHRQELHSAESMLRDITSFVSDNARCAESAKTLGMESSSTAVEGMNAVARMGETMHAITLSAQQVGEFVGLIRSIAFQTRLLSLNAAVEAARAGERGKGFAVVAAEVRHLANRSAAAADEIKAVVDSNHAQVIAGNQQAATAHAAIERMVQHASGMESVVQEIWETTFAQSSGINMLLETVGELSGAAEANAALAAESHGLADSLQNNANVLETLVNRFRLRAEAPQAA